MRVSIFTQFFPPEMEPSGFMFESLSEYLGGRKEVQDIQVVSGFPNFPKGEFINKDWLSVFKSKKINNYTLNNVLVIPSNNNNNFKRILNYTSYLFFAVLKGLLMKKSDVLIATSPPIFVGLAGLIVSKIKGSKFVLDVRDIWPESAVQMGTLKNKFIISFLEMLERLLYNNASLITVATPGMIEIIKTKTKKNVRVEYIPCGVNIPNLENKKEKFSNPFLQFEEKKFFVLYAGLHGFAQNLTTIIDAANLLKENKNISFYFIGDGPDKNRIKNYTEKLALRNVTFFDPLPRDEIRKFFKYTDCAIVPLRDLEIFKNVFPSKTFELMSYGVPTIVGVGGEIEKIINSTSSGISVKPDNATEYAKAILKYAQDKQFTLNVKENAIYTARKYFDYKVTNKRFLELFKDLK